MNDTIFHSVNVKPILSTAEGFSVMDSCNIGVCILNIAAATILYRREFPGFLHMTRTSAMWLAGISFTTTTLLSFIGLIILGSSASNKIHVTPFYWAFMMVSGLIAAMLFIVLYEYLPRATTMSEGDLKVVVDRMSLKYHIDPTIIRRVLDDGPPGREQYLEGIIDGQIEGRPPAEARLVARRLFRDLIHPVRKYFTTMANIYDDDDANEKDAVME